MRVRRLKSTHPFHINDDMEIEFDPMEIKEGELPIIPEIWYDETEE